LGFTATSRLVAGGPPVADGEFCGSIGLRWQPETSALPSHVPGHIGYSVVAWRWRRGYAIRAQWPVERLSLPPDRLISVEAPYHGTPGGIPQRRLRASGCLVVLSLDPTRNATAGGYRDPVLRSPGADHLGIPLGLGRT
jgi:hypothetical protein